MTDAESMIRSYGLVPDGYLVYVSSVKLGPHDIIPHYASITIEYTLLKVRPV